MLDLQSREGPSPADPVAGFCDPEAAGGRAVRQLPPLPRNSFQWHSRVNGQQSSGSASLSGISGISDRATAQDRVWQRYVRQVRDGKGGSFTDQWARFEQIFIDRQAVNGPPLVWQPAGQAERSNLRALMRDLLSTRDTFESVACAPDDPINILFSSGTTGTPKAIPWTHLTPIKSAMDGHFHQDIHGEDVVAWPTNIGWMMGPWLIFATFINDATMALFDGAPHSTAFTRFVGEAEVTMLGVVPSLVRAWRAADAVGQSDWPRVRVLSSTGEPSNREDSVWLMSRTGYRAPIIEYLGGTEIGGGHLTGTFVQPASPSTFTTPALGVDVVVLDPAGDAVAAGAAGELFLVPPSIGLSQRLLNQDHEQVYYAGCPPGPHGEVLRRHGDHIALLPQGFFKAQGRADDTMNLGGIKVSSVELERVVERHDAV